MVRISLDSNILIYAEGTDDLAKRDIVIALISRVGPENLLLTMQAAGETLRWLMGRGKLDPRLAVQKMQKWFAQSTSLPMTVECFHTACSIIEKHSFQLWDAAILAASAEANANILMSEDMQHGFVWQGVTIVNPFKLSNEELQSLFPQNTFH